MAAQPHSWCVPGAGLYSWLVPPENKTFDTVVRYVCIPTSQKGAGFGNCCNETFTADPNDANVKPRWTLACVQKAAEYARDVLKFGDPCGRYAWAQGPIANTQQYYPRDFSLFSLGDAKGLGDVQGPVAAQGNITAASFSLDLRQQEPVALVTAGNLTFDGGGTVWGSVFYGGTLSYSPSVTYTTGPPPKMHNATSTSPIDFSKASTALLNMSKQVALYDPIKPTPTPSNRQLKFTGSDSELNVFSIPSTALSGVTVFQFAVPIGSAVIINVTGKTVAFWNAGSTTGTGGLLSTLNLQSVLWNFPDATTLTISSTTIPGSILAPKAAANFSYGNIVGTVVAKSVASSAELEWNPYQVPSSGGCLSLDPSWSCSHDTAIDDTGLHAAAIKAEAGFLDIPLDNYTVAGHQRTSPEHRIWYAFQPAVTTPTSKPLVVFFNGGPGSATSSLLFSFNTATWTLDPNNPNTKATGIAVNPNNWTQFANLLYIDAPATGFSYPLGYYDSAGTFQKPDIGIDASRDAGIFLQVITRFLVRHPALMGNRVILVPESYGGQRATLMLYYLYKYGDLAHLSILTGYNDSQVLSDLQQYFTHVFMNPNPTPAQIQSIFGHQVMIEPTVAFLLQNQLRISDYLALNRPVCNATFSNEPCCLASNNPGRLCSVSGERNNTSDPNDATCDQYNCDRPWDWQNGQDHIAAVNLNMIATLTTALGVDPTTIVWMQSGSRTLAYGRNGANGGGRCFDGTNTGQYASSEVALSTQSMKDAFGQLHSADGTDCYFIVLNDQVNYGYAKLGEWEDMGAMVAGDFLTNVQNRVATFITVAQLDQCIWSPSIADALNDFADPNNSNADQNIESLISSAIYSSTGANGSGVSFLGSMTLKKSSALFGSVAMPAYLSGHSVSVRQPAALLQNAMEWYAAHP
jgi:choice-of-anchor A domain-containing protein